MTVQAKIRDIFVGVLLCLLIMSFQTHANQTDNYDFVYKHVDNLTDRLLAHSAQANNAHATDVFQNTRFIIDKELKLPAIALAINDEQREIRISSEWVTALSKFIETVTSNIEKDYNYPHHVEDGPDRLQSLVLVALSDVVLHEFGHHIKNAFYGVHPMPYRVYWAENTAENWSMHTKFKLDMDDNELGKLLTLSSALLALYEARQKGIVYPPYATVLLEQRFTEFCYQVRNALIDSACQHIMAKTLTADVKTASYSTPAPPPATRTGTK